jgi:hypothetical protein
VPRAGERTYLVVVAFAPLSGTVALTARGVDLPCARPAVASLSPLNQRNATATVRSVSSGEACDGGWGEVGSCVDLSVAFGAASVAKRGAAGTAMSSAALLSLTCE